MSSPLQMRPNDMRGCCYWRDFEADFEHYWTREFHAAPLLDDWKAARRDWLSGNTGYEAFRNAIARAKDREDQRQVEAMIANGLITVERAKGRLL